MKKFLLIFMLMFSLVICVSCSSNRNNTNEPETSDNENTNQETKKSIFADYNGFLHVDGNKLLNEHNEVIQLKGAVLANNATELFPYELLENLKVKWNVNCVKVGIKPNLDRSYYDKMYDIIDNAIKLDLYVVVIYWSGDVVKEENREVGNEFFKEVSEKYKNIPNILYELANEPGSNWDVIKSYANYVIPTIKKSVSNPVILCPTSGHDSLCDAIKSQLDYNNTMYICHVYIGSSVDSRWVSNAYYSNLCVFISEWCNKNDFGEFANEETAKFAKLLDRYQMSSTFFNMGTAKRENSLSTFIPSTYDYTLNDYSLTETGTFFRDYMLNKLNVSYTDDDYKMLSNTNSVYNTYFWAPEYRLNIKNIYTTNNFNIPTNAFSVYSLSATSAGNVISYIIKNTDNTYDMYIAVNGDYIIVDTFERKFSHFEILEKIDLTYFKSNAKTAFKLFDSCYKLKTIIGIENIITNKLENLSGAFSYCKELAVLDLTKSDLSSITNYSEAFTSINANLIVKVKSQEDKDLLLSYKKTLNIEVID